MRDLDVLSTDVVGVCAGHVDTTDLSALLDDRRTAERGVLLAVLASDPVSDLLIDLVALSAGLGLDRAAAAARRRLDQPAAPFAHAAIRRLWRRTARRGRDPDSLSEDARHDLRKAFKALRYALDDLGSLLGRKDLKHRLRDIRGAQEVLGYLNDVRNAESLVSLTAEEEARSGVRPAASVDRAVGFCLGWHRAEAARAWARARRRVSLDPDAA
jgi:CHAD domain-containing protein